MLWEMNASAEVTFFRKETWSRLWSRYSKKSKEILILDRMLLELFKSFLSEESLKLL